MNYGLPYKGCKNKIAKEIVEFLPEAEHFYDLFAGGCAMTHAAMLSGKWQTFTINDIDDGIVTLFLDAVAGKYSTENRWISRETFELLKDSDPYIKYCWSFGNNGRDYMYSRQLEPFKKLLHEMFFAKTPHDARLVWRVFTREFDKQRLESLERLERLQSLQSLEKYSGDYQDVPIKPNSVIYCDIPYFQTDGYGEKKNDFDYERFYRWASEQSEPIYISEYWMPEDRFECVWERQKTSSFGTGNCKKTTEKLFIPKRR